ncbi:hypothetical protein KCU78_g5359, partial [Aureobasidium melanogenum]
MAHDEEEDVETCANNEDTAMTDDHFVPSVDHEDNVASAGPATKEEDSDEPRALTNEDKKLPPRSNTGACQKLRRISATGELMEIDGRCLEVLTLAVGARRMLHRNGKAGCQAGKTCPKSTHNETSLEITPALINDITTNSTVAITSASADREAFEKFKERGLRWRALSLAWLINVTL